MIIKDMIASATEAQSITHALYQELNTLARAVDTARPPLLILMAAAAHQACDMTVQVIESAEELSDNLTAI